ncbi:hypothetical protein FBEOM_3398 [Fusarium beomiforme]|uniref:Uncharacterized protein n=1 Tax=Fusarium beomiforme TaxID=44412 RepID=A0A9P5E0Z4_9HYPO|nr:hypothetical protein FBEOM_3398 [Fusarium beomiforme]
MGVSFVKLLAYFLVGAVLAFPPPFRDIHGFMGAPTATPLSRLSPSTWKFLFPMNQTDDKTGNKEHKTKDKPRQIEDEIAHDAKHPKTDGNKYVSIDGKEAYEEERELLEKLLELLTEPKGDIPDEMASGHTQIVDNPRMKPYLWRDTVISRQKEDKDEKKKYEEDDSEIYSDRGDEEEKKGETLKNVLKREVKNEKDEEKPFLWSKHSRPKSSADA